MFGGIDAVENHRTGRGLPVLASGNGFHGTITVGYPEVHAEPGPGTPRGLVEKPDGGRLVVIPSISQQHADDIAARLKMVRHVMRHVKVPAVEPGVHGIEAVVADPPAIDRQFVQSGNGNVCPCRCNLLHARELFPEPRRRLDFVIMGIGYPASFPVVLVHHACFKRGRHGPIGPLPCFVLYPDTPEILCEWLQRNAIVHDRQLKRTIGTCQGGIPVTQPDLGGIGTHNQSI